MLFFFDYPSNRPPDSAKEAKFTATGEYILSFGSNGSDNGKFVSPYTVEATFSGKYVYVGDNGNDRIQKFRDKRLLDLFQ